MNELDEKSRRFEKSDAQERLSAELVAKAMQKIAPHAPRVGIINASMRHQHRPRHRLKHGARHAAQQNFTEA